jgi:ATP-dependent helicase/nuclease subunit A
MKNQRLIANAGSGKTYALTTRMIQLLAHDVCPTKIAALTFTRKSAGEFLSALFERVALAASSPRHLDELRGREFLEHIDAEKCQNILVSLSKNLGRLGMGTIDSLFARIARAFPLESGLAEDFNMAGEAEIQSARERTLAKLFASESSASLNDFIDLLRRATRTTGERNVFEGILRESASMHDKYLSTPSGVAWGDPLTIWGHAGCEILKSGPVSPAADQFFSAVLDTHEAFSEQAKTILQNGIEHLKALDSGARLNGKMLEFVRKRLCAENETGFLRITPKKEGWLELNPRVRQTRLQLLHSVLKKEFEAMLERSASLHKLMNKFEATYASSVRDAGLITFGDITESLARKEGDLAWLSTAGYRIDQSFEHWLLDEFQDTSRPQWKILKTFIDEVLMDEEGRRSFFYVGDTKQAIYSWRGGDPDLFFDIFEDINKHQEVICDADPLNESWRSSPPILDFVNKTFADLSTLQEPLGIPAVTIEKWSLAWEEHIPSPKTRHLPGLAQWISVPKNEAGDDENSDPQESKILEILDSIQPWKRGLSCAVLKRDNRGVESVAALLQANGIPVAVEGKTNPCVDNPLGVSVLAALRFCASPDDTLSEAIVKGFTETSAWGLENPHAFRSKTLDQLAANGFASTLSGWIGALNLENEPFLKHRGAAFLLAAEEFDASRGPSDGIPEFLRFIEYRQSQENEATGVVRVMTVHQSKGLGFDMVIASGLDKSGGGNDGTSLELGPSPKDVQWGVIFPSMDFAEQDPVLSKRLALDIADRKYGEICTAYVALTRAKKALYVLTTKLAENSRSTNFARHLLLQLGGESVVIGNENWVDAYAIESSKVEECESMPVLPQPCRGTPRAISPSSFKSASQEVHTDSGVSLHAADLGTEVHEILSKIEWFYGALPSMARASEEAMLLVERLLNHAFGKEVFCKPYVPCDVWRERSFDVMIQGSWVSGIFDRVVVERDETGGAVSAVIYDFKTDHGSISEIEAKYVGQMEVYRNAAAQLLSIDQSAITTRIVPLRSCL